MVNVKKALERIKEYWSPVIIGEMNDSYIKVAKLKGELVRHDHKNTDEVFLILKGSLIMEYDNERVLLDEGDLHVVKKGIYHNPIAKEECHVMLFESKETLHTGDVIVEKTKSIDDQIRDNKK